MATQTITAAARSGPHSASLRRWIAHTLAGEFAGFTVPASAGAAVMAAGAQDAVLLPVMVAAGSVEGAILGFAQARALVAALPGLDRSRWMLLTALAAATAWIIGMVAGTQSERLQDLPVVVLAALAAASGVLFLLTIGGFQWLELRRHVRGAGWWVPANALAWTIGVSLVVLSMALVPNDSPAFVFGLAALAGGLLMALTVALITGATMVRLLDFPRARPGTPADIY